MRGFTITCWILNCERFWFNSFLISLWLVQFWWNLSLVQIHLRTSIILRRTFQRIIINWSSLLDYRRAMMTVSISPIVAINVSFINLSFVWSVIKNIRGLYSVSLRWQSIKGFCHCFVIWVTGLGYSLKFGCRDLALVWGNKLGLHLSWLFWMNIASCWRFLGVCSFFIVLFWWLWSWARCYRDWPWFSWPWNICWVLILTHWNNFILPICK